MRTITDVEETRDALDALRKRLSAIGGNAQQLEWGFPNGDRARYPTFTLPSQLGEIQVAIPRSWSTRVPHLFRFHRDGRPPSPDVEVNIPEELDRKVSGVYTRAGDSIWLCSRGHFTAFRGKIPRSVTLAYFSKWLIEADDAGRSVNLIPVVSLSSDRMADDLAEFMSAVTELKSLFKTGDVKLQQTAQTTQATQKSGFNWNDNLEFEGQKSTGARKDPEWYEYRHGPLCNRLRRYLAPLAETSEAFEVKSNRNVDLAVVSTSNDRAAVVFEVKTSADFRSQIYSAIGQLVVYRSRYGAAKCRLVIVLPASCSAELAQVVEAASAVGIAVALETHQGFEVDGRPLHEFVTRALGL